MKVAAALLFKRNAEGLAVQFATCRNVTDDRTEARDEQNLYDFTDLHATSSCGDDRSCTGAAPSATFRRSHEARTTRSPPDRPPQKCPPASRAYPRASARRRRWVAAARWSAACE